MTAHYTEDGEELRPIPGADGYFVAATGGVYSTRVKGLRKLRPGMTPMGYLTFLAGGMKPRRSMYVHRCVALAFVDGYREGLDACHKNTIKTDNRAENLRWDDRAGNMQDSIHLLSGENGSQAKLTAEQVRYIRDVYEKRTSYFWGASQIAQEFGVSQQAVSHAAVGDTWAMEGA